MEPVAFFILIFFVALVAFIVLLRSYFSDRKARKNSINYNSSFTKLYYILESNEKFTLDRLAVRNINDNIEYIFDSDRAELSFSHINSKVEISLSFVQIQSYNYMVATLKVPFEKKNNLPLILNTFFSEKLNATPVEAYYFEALVKNNNLEI